MRRILLAGIAAAALITGAACAILRPKPATARLSFQLDTTCRNLLPGERVYSLDVDGAIVGTARLAPGGASPEFGVAAGSHTVAANLPDGTAWAPLTIEMERNQQVVYLMQCLFPFGTSAKILSPR